MKCHSCNIQMKLSHLFIDLHVVSRDASCMYCEMPRLNNFCLILLIHPVFDIFNNYRIQYFLNAIRRNSTIIFL